jgi:hypothetical protein
MNGKTLAGMRYGSFKYDQLIVVVVVVVVAAAAAVVV